jgi:hypothetical protein
MTTHLRSRTGFWVSPAVSEAQVAFVTTSVDHVRNLSTESLVAIGCL